MSHPYMVYPKPSVNAKVPPDTQHYVPRLNRVTAMSNLWDITETPQPCDWIDNCCMLATG